MGTQHGNPLKQRDHSEFLPRIAKCLHRQGYAAVKEISRAAAAEGNSKDGFATGAESIVWGYIETKRKRCTVLHCLPETTQNRLAPLQII